jgi:hypothetical protein
MIGKDGGLNIGGSTWSSCEGEISGVRRHDLPMYNYFVIRLSFLVSLFPSELWAELLATKGRRRLPSCTRSTRAVGSDHLQVTAAIAAITTYRMHHTQRVFRSTSNCLTLRQTPGYDLRRSEFEF